MPEGTGLYCTLLNAKVLVAIFASKRYKPVTLKVCLVETELPSCFRITCNIKGDLLKDMPTLSSHPPSYTPKGQYTEEQKEVIDKAHPGNFLLLEEHKLLHHFMCKQNEGFTWIDQKCSHFKEEFFPPIKIPTIPHKPWMQCNILIPLGIYKKVCKVIWQKLNARVYKPSNLSY